MFDAEEWEMLLNGARQTRIVTQFVCNTEASKIAQAEKLVREGELSHAARVLKGGGMAPLTPDTLKELRDPKLRPAEAFESLSIEHLYTEPQSALLLDRDVFAEVLRGLRRGKNTRLSGNRNNSFPSIS